MGLGLGLGLNKPKGLIYFQNKFSIDFDGVDDYINIDSLAGTMSTGQAFTISVWFKGTGQQTGNNNSNIIFSSHTASSGNIYRLGIAKSSGGIFYSDNIISDTAVGNTDYDDNKWHQLVVTKSTGASTSTFYVDGSSIGTVANTNPHWSTSSKYSIGQEYDPGGEGDFFKGNIDELALFDRELKQDEITRMYNTYYTNNKIQNGSFNEIGTEEVTNNDFSKEGSELVTNGNFALNSSWSGVGSNGWSIDTNTQTLNFTDATIYVFQNISTVQNKNYKIVLDIELTSGTLKVKSFNSLDIVAINTTGRQTVTAYFKENDSNANFGFLASGSNVSGKIHSVSVKEVGIDWSIATGWSVGDNKIVGDGTSYSSIEQNLLLLNKSAKLTFEIKDYVSGTFRMIPAYRADGLDERYSGNGVYTVYFTSLNNYLRFQQQLFVGSITNISVKEVGQNWTAASNWKIDGDKAIADGSSQGALTQTITNAVVGTTYKIQYNISNYSAGNIRFYYGGVFTAFKSANGSYSETIIATSTDGTLMTSINTPFAGDIDNIVVQELKHDATNLLVNSGNYQSASPLITSTKSMEFDGTDDYLELGSQSGNLRLANSNGSISVWINPEITGDIFQRIIDKSDGVNAANGYAVVLESNNVECYMNSGGEIVRSTTQLTANRWYHVLWTWDGTNHKLYIDSVLEDTTASVKLPPTNTTNIRMGTWNHSSAREYNGKMTEVGIYNRCLTSLEVASLYNQGVPTDLLVNRNNYQSGNPTVFNTKQVDFDGTDDYLDINKSDFLGTSDFTISGWIKPDGVSENYILGQSADNSNRWYIRLNAAGQIQTFGLNGGNQLVNMASVSALTVGEWYYFVLTNDRGALATIYLNGIQSNQSTNTNTLSWDNTGYLRLGSFEQFNRYFNGKISQIGIWNKVLTANEVSSLYNHGLPIDLNTNQAAYTSSSNLVGYWRMGNGTLDEYPVIFDQTNATLGSEKIINGDFATDSDWDKESPWTIENGVANGNGAVGSSQELKQSQAFTLGTTYKVVYTILNYVSGSIRFQIVTGGTSVGGDFHAANGTYTQYVTTVANNNQFRFKAATSFNGSIDNVSVKQVNGNPAIMTNQTASDIENGSPYANLIQNADFSEGTTDWALNSNWSISNGTANADGTSNSVIFQSNAIKDSTTYSVTYTLSNFTQGSLSIALSGSAGVSRTSAGTYTEIITSGTSPSGRIDFRGGGNFIVSVDNVYVSEVNTGLQGYWKMGDGINDEYPAIYDQTNPTLGADLVTGETSKNINSGGVYTDVFTNINATSGEILQVTFTVTNSSGTIRVWDWTNNSVIGSDTFTDGTHKQYINITSTGSSIDLRFYSPTGRTGTLSNISVKKVNGNSAYMTNMVEGNITNQFPLTKIRNYYRMGDGILDGFPIIQDQTSPNLAHIPTTNLITQSNNLTISWGNFNFDGGLLTDQFGLLSPEGLNNATRITYTNSSAGTGGSLLTQNITVLENTVYTISFYAKSISGVKQFRVSLKNSGSNGPSGSLFTVTNEWEKYSVTVTNTTSTSRGVQIRILESEISGNRTFDVWGFQLEEQSQATATLLSDGVAAVRKATTTNLIPYSEEISQYSKAGGTTVIDNNTTSPDGTVNASKVTKGGATPNERVYVDNFVISNTTNYSLSAFIKNDDIVNGGVSTIAARNNGGTLIRQGYVWNGSILSITSSQQSGTRRNVLLEDYGNGWWKIGFSFTSDSTTADIEIDIDRVNGTDTTAIFLWGVQLEEQTQAETYAPTTGLPVTIDLFTENNYGTMTNMVAGDIVLDTPNNPA